VNSERAKSIVKNAESQLVNERIRLINSQLTALRAEYSRLTDWVKCVLLAELADTVFTHVRTVQENEFVKTKARAEVRTLSGFKEKTRRVGAW